MVKQKVDHPLNTSSPTVAILMCTFNGECFLKEQLDSIAQQTYSNWVLWVSDDGSSDRTLELLRKTQAQWGEHKLHIVSGPGKGFARNFLSLTCRTEIEATYFAFSDQDDIWIPEKLCRAIGMLEKLAQDTPALYGSRTQLINAQGQIIGISKLIAHDLTFHNALVQNVVGGNTMVFNQMLRESVQSAGGELDVVSHDWWLYLLATAIKGQIIFDRQPFIHYRQHKHNLVGANTSTYAKLNRLKQLFSGRFRGWIQRNQACLKHIEKNMSADYWHAAETLAGLHRLRLIHRMTRFHQIGVRRQSVLGNCALFVAVALNQV
jgi:glycosyltransferase involved in cell wall biosynthesis